MSCVDLCMFSLIFAEIQNLIYSINLSIKNLICNHPNSFFRPYTVVVGADSLSGNESTKQEFTTVKSIPHPNYDGHENDIMLLKVRTLSPAKNDKRRCDKSSHATALIF